MKNKIILIIIFLIAGNLSAQKVRDTENNFKLMELSEIFLDDSITVKKETVNTGIEHKSPGISVLLSAILPGAGHYYTGRMDVGSYFLGAEVGLWLGLIGVNYYGGVLQDDSRSFAAVHAGLNKEGKDDDYFANVGTFLNIYQYNNDKLQSGQYDKIYDINTHFWNWDSADNQGDFDQQRKKSERTYNLSTIFVTGLIVNRLVSGISALVLTNKVNSSGIKVSSGFTTSPENKIDGLKLNFVKSF